MKQSGDITVHDAAENDFPAIRDIYAHYVEHTTASLEENPPTLEEMLARWKNSTDKSLPYLVAKIDGRITGYAYAMQYRPRTAYRYTLEESVYVAKDYQGMGVGRKLLSELIKRCSEKGYKQMLAVIAGADNLASISLHHKLGFKPSGVLEKFGFKFDRWIDTVLMQKAL